MATLTRLWLGVAVLLAGCTSAPSPSATAIPSAVVQGPVVQTSMGPLVQIDTGLTPVAHVGGEIVLEFDVSNVGPREIPDLTIIVNDGYMTNMAVIETSPQAIRQSEQGGEYFTFGTLPKGATQTYVIRMSPNNVGDFTADVVVAEWSSEMGPLSVADGGVAEYSYETQVFSR